MSRSITSRAGYFGAQKHVSKDPFGQFHAWYQEACNKKGLVDPNAMCLATVSKEGYPSVRYMWCRAYGNNGFKFFTNPISRKAKEMESNPNVAAAFNWGPLNRSIRIEGCVEKLDPVQSTKYLQLRPVPSHKTLCTSHQSFCSFQCGRESVLKTEYMIPDKEIPKPDFWSVYIIRPRTVEFWQAQRGRLDRIKFKNPKEGEKPDGKLLHEGEDGWIYERMRMKYRDPNDLFLEENLVSKEPIGQFLAWFEEAKNNKGVKEPNSMCLSTVSKKGLPSARFMLCKEFDKDGFKFFTNYESQKGQEMASNPNVAVTFYWPGLNKQVRIEGEVEKMDPELSTKYWRSRPPPSQISAYTSNQSKPVMSRDVLHEREHEFEVKYKELGQEIPRPDYWGGYILRPNSFEFWQGQTNRLHDRIRFRRPKLYEEPDGKLLHKGEDGWVFERLCP